MQCDTLCMYICKCSVLLSTQTPTHTFFCCGAPLSSAINHSWLSVPGVFYCSSFLKEAFVSCFSKLFCCLCGMRNFYTNQSIGLSWTFHIKFCTSQHGTCLEQAYQLTLAGKLYYFISVCYLLEVS